MDTKKIIYYNGMKVTYEEFLNIFLNKKCEYRDGKIYFMSPTSLKHKLIIEKLKFSTCKKMLKKDWFTV
jgi:Uma2 family endonuclease